MAFGYYKALTIQTGQVPSSQSGFPVLLPFLGGDANLKTVGNGGHVQSASGYDIRPYSDSGLTTTLTFELVPGSYNATTGAFEMWVNMTAADGNVVYLAYGDNGISTDGSSSSTWDTNYLGVIHFGTSASLNTLDSKNGGIGRTNGSAVAGQIGGGNSIGIGNFATWDNSSPSTESIDLPGSSDKTFSFWFNIAGPIVTGGLFLGSLSAEQFQVFAGDDNVYWDDGGSGNGRIHTSYLALYSTWAYVTLVSKGDDSFGAIYLNGAQKVTRSIGQTPTSTSTGLITPYVPGTAFSIDEYRLSKIVRSTNWIATEYNNQSAPTSFWSTGSETVPGGGGSSFNGGWAKATHMIGGTF